jgi:hypothetical protein
MNEEMKDNGEREEVVVVMVVRMEDSCNKVRLLPKRSHLRMGLARVYHLWPLPPLPKFPFLEGTIVINSSFHPSSIFFESNILDIYLHEHSSEYSSLSTSRHSKR